MSRNDNARTRSVDEAGRQINTRMPYGIEKKPQATAIFLDCTKEKIYYAWLRGKSERQIAKEYGVSREHVEEINRELITGMNGNGPDRPAGAAVIPMKRAA